MQENLKVQELSESFPVVKLIVKSCKPNYSVMPCRLTQCSCFGDIGMGENIMYNGFECGVKQSDLFFAFELVTRAGSVTYAKQLF